MAVVSPVGFHLQRRQMDENQLLRCSSGNSGGGGGSIGEIEELEALERAGTSSSVSQRGSPSVEGGEKIFVAVDKEYKESKSTLIWALQNFPRDKKFVLVHVHRPVQKIPMFGGKFPASQLSKPQVIAYRLQEREKMKKTLDEYLLICSAAKVQAETLVIEMDDLAKGLLTLIAQHGITKLVMGAASDKYYTKKMKSPKSNTANILQREAPPSCSIWFACKGNLICTRSKRRGRWETSLLHHRRTAVARHRYALEAKVWLEVGRGRVLGGGKVLGGAPLLHLLPLHHLHLALVWVLLHLLLPHMARLLPRQLLLHQLLRSLLLDYFLFHTV